MLVFNECRVSVGEDEKVLEMDGGDSCTNMPQNCTLKNDKMVNFMLCIFYHNKQKKNTFLEHWTLYLQLAVHMVQVYNSQRAPSFSDF